MPREKSNMASSAIKELRACTSLMRQCCSNWKGFNQTNVTKSVAVVSGNCKCVLVTLIYKIYLVTSFFPRCITQLTAGARYTKSIASLELRHKELNNDPYSLHNNTIDFTLSNETIVHILTWYIEHHPNLLTCSAYFWQLINSRVFQEKIHLILQKQSMSLYLG